MGEHAGLCNLYSSTRPQSEIGRAFGIEHEEAGNLSSLPGIFLNSVDTVVRMRDGARALTTEPNAEVGAVHPKAMPAILTTDEERAALTAHAV